ncbi:MAG TPA: LysR substrate-binding domain-containing protein [Thermomicrobiales bacterium]|nr:LysR substrate-binding domain-containing protein [Thermomicrobiales bacterium]HRA46585.1 LysR substrate-binding domain-containing protein [Thermomicrobiales bacterium]
MQFTLRQLELFIAACEMESISAAAGREHIAQSALSAAIRNLEDSLGVTLLVRNHAVGVSPTASGRELLVRARLLIAEAREIESLAVQLGAHVAGPVPVGFLVSIAPLLMARSIRTFNDDHPGATLRVLEGDQDQLVVWLRDGTIALAVTYDLGVRPGLTFDPVMSVPPVVLLPADHRLAKRTGLHLAELVSEPCILLDLPVSTDYFLGLFLAEGISPNPAFRSSSTAVVRSLVQQGLGYTIVNLQAFEPAENTVGVPLLDANALHLGLLAISGGRETGLARAARQHLTNQIRIRVLG